MLSLFRENHLVSSGFRPDGGRGAEHSLVLFCLVDLKLSSESLAFLAFGSGS